jgi:hypothetical protein
MPHGSWAVGLWRAMCDGDMGMGSSGTYGIIWIMERDRCAASAQQPRVLARGVVAWAWGLVGVRSYDYDCMIVCMLDVGAVGCRGGWALLALFEWYVHIVKFSSFCAPDMYVT